jgi:hypothetical protein
LRRRSIATRSSTVSFRRCRCIHLSCSLSKGGVRYME